MIRKRIDCCLVFRPVNAKQYSGKPFYNRSPLVWVVVGTGPVISRLTNPFKRKCVSFLLHRRESGGLLDFPLFLIAPHHLAVGRIGLVAPLLGGLLFLGLPPVRGKSRCCW